MWTENHKEKKKEEEREQYWGGWDPKPDQQHLENLKQSVRLASGFGHAMEFKSLFVVQLGGILLFPCLYYIYI